VVAETLFEVEDAMTISPKAHVLFSITFACACAVAVRLIYDHFQIELPIGLVVNIGFASLFVALYVSNFPWKAIMLLDSLERTYIGSIPHKPLRWWDTNCEPNNCLLKDIPQAKCLRMRYMKDITEKRVERVQDQIRWLAGLYSLAIVVIFIAAWAGIFNGAQSALVPAGQVIQILLGLIMVSLPLARLYGEVNYQRSINLDLLV
jgi:hypothetical protein